MGSKVLYKSSVRKDLKRIDPHRQKKILDEIEEELSKDPVAGKRLTGEYDGLFSYRVGDYRAVYTLIPEGVLILRISHRKESYR